MRVFRDESLLQHVYFSAVTVFTVGFGDMYPLTETSRVGVLMQSFAVLMAITMGLAFLVSFEVSRSEKTRCAVLAMFRSLQRPV